MHGTGSTSSTSRAISMESADRVAAGGSSRIGRAKSPGEAALWQAHLTVLQQALRLGKPDALARLRSEAARLEREVEALQGRKALAERSSSGEAHSAQLADAIAERLRRISDLAGLLRRHGGRARTD